MTPSSASADERFERLALLHAGAFVVLCSWGFGGNVWWLELPLQLFGALSIPILCIGFLVTKDYTRCRRMSVWTLLVLLVYNAIVLAGLLNPNHHAVYFGNTRFLAPGGDITWLPSVAKSADTLNALAWFDVAVLSALSVYSFVHNRRRLRALLFVLISNALLLAIFGTLQNFLRAPGPYFGLVKAPNTYFFSTFLYHNHWGPFMILCLSMALGLAWHYYRREGGNYRDIWHSPSMTVLVITLFLAASIPLSASRSCTVLALLLLSFALFHYIRTVISRNRRQHKPSTGPIAFALFAVGFGVAGVIWSAEPVIEQRIQKTIGQLTDEKDNEVSASRFVAYHDTLNLFLERPVFGWGRGSYSTAFYTFNSQDRLRRAHPSVYRDAHSDWLQCLAENGIVGSLLILLVAAIPTASILQTREGSILARYLLIGCGLVLFQALYEFPFGNPGVALLWWLCFLGAARYTKLKS